MPNSADAVEVRFTLPDDQAAALSEVMKRLARSNIGPDGLNLTNPHTPGEDFAAEAAIHVLRSALARAGYDPR